MQPQPASAIAPNAASIDPTTVSPHLAALLKEREQLQAKMAALTGAVDGVGTSDPRYAVAGMAERRADFQRWADARDARRSLVKRDIGRPRPAGAQPDADKPAGIDSVAGRMMAPRAKALHVAPALRPTPGETAGGGGTPLDAQAFAEARDAARALFAPPGETSRPSNDRSGLLDRAIDRWAEMRDKSRMAETALGKARRAIPDDWQRRAKAAIPALSEPKGYAERTRELLTVAVGSIDQLTELADKMRDVRELKAADEAHDDARRERALAKLQAKRREEV
ncbi:hypothetical protein CA233_09555 [Sphingomonas sp. ABOLD]|nr:hypothetical protein CA234_11135 [Sphingomonas sp. ABOLE]RSV48545.1 hypothetical protein CA233_09555 [Sphingomonas sp. ABOLD]